MFTKLFSSITLGRATLPNRIIFGGHRTNLSEGGLVGKELLAYYGRRARGGCGAVVVGEASLHAADQPHEKMILAYQPEAASGLGELAREIQGHGAAAFLNLNHCGFQGDGAVSRREVWGPSAVADVLHGETAKPMEPEDMAEVAAAFAAGAVLARECGFDGVVVDLGAESLLRQFLSLICNHRQDEYGGGLENRLRFPLAVIAATRAAVGADYTLGASLCLDEQFWGGLDGEAGQEIARALESTGQVDFLSATLGTYYNMHLTHPTMHTPEGFAIDLAAAAKAAISLPVVANHQIPGPGMAEEILAGVKADAIGLVRPLICDPDLPNKAREGRADEIRPCVRDNQGCVGRTAVSRKIGCILNPEAGREAKLAAAAPAEGGKKVLVIGAGPAGLAAAAEAGRRGCRVSGVREGREAGRAAESGCLGGWPPGPGRGERVSDGGAGPAGRGDHNRPGSGSGAGAGGEARRGDRGHRFAAGGQAGSRRLCASGGYGRAPGHSRRVSHWGAGAVYR